jgi:predicted MFS family arabinose efflux permease
MYDNTLPGIATGTGIGGGVLAHTGAGFTPLMALYLALAAFALIAGGAALTRTFRHVRSG